MFPFVLHTRMLPVSDHENMYQVMSTPTVDKMEETHIPTVVAI